MIYHIILNKILYNVTLSHHIIHNLTKFYVHLITLAIFITQNIFLECIHTYMENEINKNNKIMNIMSMYVKRIWLCLRSIKSLTPISFFFNSSEKNE